MNTSNELSRSKNRNPDQGSKILWWFSTAIPESIQHSESDRYRAKIIGLGVMFTWIYASIAWIYLWSTTIGSPLVYISLGLFIGFGILTIDRMLIASISKYRKNFIAIALRVLLALFLGAFIAQPLILWMFNQDIDTEIAILQEDKVREKQSKLEDLYLADKAYIGLRLSEIADEKNRASEAIQVAEREFLAEIDGTGGSMRYGIAGVAARKEAALNRAKSEYNQNLGAWTSESDSLSTRLTDINSTINKQLAGFREKDLNSGFLIRVEALMSLFEKDSTGALKKRYYLILMILVIFELIPIISKLFLQTGSYDDRVKIRDEMEIEIAASGGKHEYELKQQYNRLARDADMELLEILFSEIKEQRISRINGNVKKWEKEQIATFDQLWEKVKSDILTRQEN